VLGGGNSACDVAAEAARVGASCDLSLRRGYRFLPKTLFGVPLADIGSGWFPMWAQRLFLRAMLRVVDPHASLRRMRLAPLVFPRLLRKDRNLRAKYEARHTPSPATPAAQVVHPNLEVY
jgi:cation diffusion facilitator CzcD-associated flavoprotein CzcO